MMMDLYKIFYLLKITKWRKINIDFRIFFATLLFAIPLSKATGAESSNMNLQHEIDSLGDIQSVKVVLVPKDSAFRENLNEKSILEVGCTYISSNKLEIYNLKNILKKSEPKLISSNSSVEFLMRYGIYLTLSDHVLVRILFGDSATGQYEMAGTYSRAETEYEYVHFISSKSLPADLFEWASMLSNNFINGVKKSNYCNQPFEF